MVTTSRRCSAALSFLQRLERIPGEIGQWRQVGVTGASRMNSMASSTSQNEQGAMHASKSEHEKMISGELFDALDEELVKMRAAAKRSFHHYNTHLGYEEDLARRQQHLSKLFASVGPNCIIEPPFFCDYGTNIHIGANFYSNFDVIILDCAKVTIGQNVLLAPRVQIYTATHPLDVETRHEKGLEFAMPVTIGNNVWIGGNAIVLPGVCIGDGCVIGAGAVVTKDVPPFSLAVGNPARVSRKLT